MKQDFFNMFDDKFDSNEDALVKAKEKDDEAILFLVNNFRFFIRKNAGLLANTYRNVRIDYDDLEMVGIKAVLHAIEMHNRPEIPFAAFCTTIIKNAMWNMIQQEYSPTTQQFNDALSLDELLFNDNDTFTLADAVGEIDPHFDSQNVGNGSVEFLEEMLVFEFSEEELNIIKARLKGYNSLEIRAKFNLSKRELDIVLKSIREKYEAQKQ